MQAILLFPCSFSVQNKYGGFSAYNLMGIHGDLYDCIISHAGIFEEKMFWFTTEEAWFGNWDNGGLTEYAYEPGITGPKGDGITFGGMQQAGAPYADREKTKCHYANDPSSKITQWHTPILCIHGMLDFRIPYEQGMAAFNAAQMMGVPSKLIVFPEECHFINQPQNCIYWQREFFGWLERWIR